MPDRFLGRGMKRILFFALLLGMLSVGSTNLLANAFVNFAGVQGFLPTTNPSR
jgi:hypothetical protein